MDNLNRIHIELDCKLVIHLTEMLLEIYLSSEGGLLNVFIYFRTIIELRTSIEWHRFDSIRTPSNSFILVNLLKQAKNWYKNCIF